MTDGIPDLDDPDFVWDEGRFPVGTVFSEGKGKSKRLLVITGLRSSHPWKVGNPPRHYTLATLERYPTT